MYMFQYFFQHDFVSHQFNLYIVCNFYYITCNRSMICLSLIHLCMLRALHSQGDNTDYKLLIDYDRAYGAYLLTV